ncbi:MAG: hypothetical protein K8W52_23305 [Deltaproteobacteria bacterium]|nr:hypothetical protein [Deltaproteobacteria bacterium]
MKPAVRAILLGGAIAGLLDITYACVHSAIASGATPTQVLHSVAAGAIGRDAAKAGGVPTAALGLALHFFIALSMAACFVGATRVEPRLNRWPVLAGLVYGRGLYVVMNYVVVPLSAIGAVFHAPTGQFFYGALVTHTLFVGIPIALCARRYAAA